jgi:hypothetical protein
MPVRSKRDALDMGETGSVGVNFESQGMGEEVAGRGHARLVETRQQGRLKLL